MIKQFDESTYTEEPGAVDHIEMMLEMANLTKKRQEHVRNAVDLLETPYQPMQWAVKDILPEGCVLFAGRPKLGKSWLAYQVALSIAEGSRVFGEIDVKQGDVLYLALEDGVQRLQWRLRTLLRGRPVPRGLDLAMDWPALDDGGMDELHIWLGRHPEARLVIIDTFQRVKPDSIGSSMYSIDFNSLKQLTDLTREFPICIMVVHHTRKAGAEDAFDTLSGSTGLTGAVDALIVLKRSRGRADAEMHITGRDIEESTKAFHFDKAMMRWQLLGEAQEFWLTVDRAAILNLLREAPTGMRAGTIADNLDKKEMTIRKVLSRMLRDGQIRLLDRGLYTTAS